MEIEIPTLRSAAFSCAMSASLVVSRHGTTGLFPPGIGSMTVR